MFHVLNRGVGRRTLFDKDPDFLAFERVVEETLRTCSMQVCAYCLMSNHWHFVVWPAASRTRRSGVPDTLRMAAATACRLAANRQPAAVRIRVGRAASLRQSRPPLGRCRVGRADGETTEPRIDAPAAWKAETAAVGPSNGDAITMLLIYARFGGCHLFFPPGGFTSAPVAKFSICGVSRRSHSFTARESMLSAPPMTISSVTIFQVHASGRRLARASGRVGPRRTSRSRP